MSAVVGAAARLEPQPAVPGAREHPLENQRVQMDVEVERPAKSAARR